MDRETHQRYLEYLDRHAYFGATKRVLPMAEFLVLDREHAELTAREADLDDEERRRFDEVAALLHRD